jgi:hypothetical protein
LNEGIKDELVKKVLQKYLLTLVRHLSNLEIRENDSLKKDLIRHLSLVNHILREFGKEDVHWNAIWNNCGIALTIIEWYLIETQKDIQNIEKQLGVIAFDETKNEIESLGSLKEFIKSHYC